MIKKRQGASPRAALHSDNKLFRTSTTYLLDPTEALEPEKLASFAKNSQNHVSYFAQAKPEEFQLKAAAFTTQEEVKLSMKMTQSIPTTPENNVNIQIRLKQSKKKENRLPTPKNFAQITNVLREAVAGHKFMKEKLKQAKLQQEKEKPTSPRNQQTPRKDRGFVFSTSPSPISSPKHLPPSARSPHSQRYQVSGSMTERYNKRQTEMAELIQQYKMINTSKQFEQCTFQPSLPAKAKNKRIMEKRQVAVNNRKSRQVQDEGADNVFIKIHNRQIMEQRKPPFKFDQFKSLIKFELDRIPLQKDREH